MSAEVKEKSVIDEKIEQLLNAAVVLEMFKGWFEPKDYFSVQNAEITLWPDSEDTSRRYVGALMRIFNTKPTFGKYDNRLIAYFNYGGVHVKVWNYKTRKCQVVKRTVEHPAVPAKDAWVEEVEELVCDLPSVEQEVAPVAEPAPSPEPAKEEVPF
jgi:hypothetical protein